MCKRGNSGDIVVIFSGKSHHKVKLYLGFSRLVSDTRRAKDILLGYVFVDNVAQARTSRLGRKGQRSRANRRNLFHKLFCEAVRSERRKRKIYLFVLCPFKQCVGKLVYAGIVTY